MKPKTKGNKKRIKRNNITDSNKVHHTLNGNNTNYYLPEFMTNKTIKKYVATKLLNNKKLKDNGLNVYTKAIEPKNKICSLSKEKKKNSKLNFNKHNNNKSQTMPKNGGNFENVNTHNSVTYNTTNISNTEVFNDYLNQGCYSYREINPYNSTNSIENLNDSNHKFLNHSSNLKNKNIIVFSKKHIINKLNANINNMKIKCVFNNDNNDNNNDYYTYHNYFKNKSHNNILKDNGIYVKIKNINKSKAKKIGKETKENINLSPDKNQNQNQNPKNKNKISPNLNDLNKDNDIYVKPISIQNNNGQNINKKKKIFKNREDLIIKKKIENGLTIKEDNNNNIINYILNSITKNASKIEKRLNAEKKETKSRLFSPLLNKNKNNNVVINNANIIKCGYANRGKYIFEYQNQIKRK